MKIELEELKKAICEIKNLIEEKLPQPLPFKEAAKYLSISPSYLYKLVSKRLVKCYKPSGKILYFRVEDLNAWAFSNGKKTLGELKQCA